MAINVNKFVPRPGIINKQGCLPDPSELVCIEVPKVFDQCLIKRCLVYGEGPDTKTTDMELRSDPLDNPRRYINSSDFKVKLISLEQFSIRGKPGYKKLILHYLISFYAHYIDCDGVNKKELYEINRTDVIGKFYCPDSIAQVSINGIGHNRHQSQDTNIIKLEMIAEVLDGKLLRDCEGNHVLDITLGYFLVVKCQIIVQLLIPAYDYCPDLKEPCEEEPEEDPCVIFSNTSLPSLYPTEGLEPLFPEYKGEERKLDKESTDTNVNIKIDLEDSEV